MDQNLLERAHLLIQQHKFEEARKILSGLLSSNPENPYVLTSLAEVMLQLGDMEEALKLINNAISISPDVDFFFYNKSRILLQLNHYDEAEDCLREAVSMNASDDDYYALWASIKLARKQYAEARELADQSLQLNPENILALNARSTALLKLGNREESFETIENALKEDPNNAYTHTNHGWLLLEKGDHKKALEHFSEALRNDPNFEYAQAGMVQALKAKYGFYRLFLKYAFWMSNLTSKYQWGVIIGFYIMFRILRSFAENNEALRPFLVPLLVLLGLVAFSTWVISPLSNLFLRLNRYGRYLLDKNEIISSNLVGLSLLVSLAGLLVFIISGDIKWLAVAVYGFAMMVPFSAIFAPSKYKYALPLYCAAMGLVGIAGILQVFSNGEIFNGFTMAFLIGFVAYQWIANYLLIKADTL